MFPKLHSLVVLIPLLFAAAAAHAQATLSVGPGQTYTTIQSAINAANPGDTVLVAPGTYYENINFGTNSITVASSGGAASTIIDGQQLGTTVTMALPSKSSPATLNGFTVRNAAEGPNFSPSGGIQINGPANVLNNIVTANHSCGINVSGGPANIEGDTVSNNVELTGYAGSDCQVDGVGIEVDTDLAVVPVLIQGNTVDGNQDAGISVGDTPTVTILNNIVRNTHAALENGNGIALYLATGVVSQNIVYNNAGLGLLFSIGFEDGTQVDNNLFFANDAIASYPYSGEQIDLFPETGDLFANNIVIGLNSSNPIVCNAAIRAEHNLFYPAPAPAAAQDRCDLTPAIYGNLFADPKLVNAAAGDFHLTAASPALDAGINSISPVLSADFDSNTRLQDATGKGYPIIDIGPYEFSGTVDASSTSLTLQSNAPFYSALSTATITATLTSPLGTPGGAVTLYVDGISFATANANAGKATFSVASLTPGTHHISASYAGSTPFPPTLAPHIYVSVSDYTVNVAMTSSLNPSGLGQAVTFNVKVSSQDGTVPSPIQLSDGGNSLATLTPDASGNASFTSSSLTIGSHNIQASYAGDATHASAVAYVNQMVLVASSTTLSSSLNPSTYGQSVTFTATVTGAASAAAPTGSVTFSNSGAFLGSATIVSSTASWTISTLAVGSHTITATYTSDSNHTASSATMTQSVNATAPTPLVEPVGTTSTTQTATLTFTTAGTLSKIAALTLGAPNLDFNLAGGGTCSTSTTYTANQTCTVNFTFTPSHPGQRAGAIVLGSNTGAILATTYISGLGTGPQINFGPVDENLIGNGLVSGSAIAVDAANNIFLLDTQLNELIKETPTGSGSYTQSVIASGLSYPEGIAVDGAGAIYFTQSAVGGAVLIKETPTNGTYVQSTFYTSISGALMGVVVDGTGDVYVAEMGSDTVREFTFTGTSYTESTTFTAPSPLAPYALAVDSSGNVFLSEVDNTTTAFTSTILELVPSSGALTPTVIISGLLDVSSLAINPAGIIFYSQPSQQSVSRLAVLNGAYYTVPVTTGVGSADAVTLDGAGNIYIAALNNTHVRIILAGTPSLIPFNSTPVGTTGSDSPRMVSLTNYGNANLVFSVPSSGPNPTITSGFTVDSSTTCPQLTSSSSTVTLAPNTTCHFSIDFKPVTPGVDNGFLVPTDNNLNVASATQLIPLSGTGTGNSISAQTITFPQPATPAFVQTSATLTATATSGLPITYTIISGPATISGSVITYTAPGTVVVEADQAGNSTFSAATPVQRTVTVTPLTEPVGTTSPILTTTLTFTASGTLGNSAILTRGVANLDFNAAAGSTCVTGTTYTAGQTCTVAATFTPTHPGQRNGGITLTDPGGNLLASTLISGTGTGPQVTFSPGTEKTIVANLTFPSGAAVDASGNIFFSDSFNNTVKEALAAGGYTNIKTLAFASGHFNFPEGVALDGNGNVFVGDTDNFVVKEILAAGGYTTVVTLAPTFSANAKLQMEGLAVDAAGNVFVAARNPANQGGSVLEITAASGYSNVTTLSNNFTLTTSVAVDHSGNVFVGSLGNSYVQEMLAVNGVVPVNPTIVNIVTNLNTPGTYDDPFAVAVDASGNLFVADSVVGSAYEVSAASNYTHATVLATDFSFPLGVVPDASGDVFVVDNGHNRLIELDYADPPTLNFATTNVGSTSPDSPQTVTVINDGNQPLGFPSLAGPNPSITHGFTISPTSTCPQIAASASAQAIGDSCTYAVNFTPDTYGPISGQLTLTDQSLNLSNAIQIVHLNGTGAGAPPTIASTATLTATPSTTTPGSAVTLTATIAALVPPSNPIPTGTVTFFQGSATIGTVTLNASGVATLTLHPEAFGPTPFTCSYSGDTSYIASTCNAASVNFTGLTEPVGTTSSVLTTTLTFTTSGTLGTISVLTQGSDSLDFRFVSGGSCSTGTTYAAGQTCIIAFTFDPTVPGLRLGGITLTDAASDILANTHLSGLGTGPQVIFTPAAQSTIISGVRAAGLAFDGSGNLFVADSTTALIEEYTAASNYQSFTTFGSGFSGPTGLAIDGSGNLFVTDQVTGTVSEVLAAGNYTTTLTVGSGLIHPTSIAVDAAGNLFVPDNRATFGGPLATIKELLAASGYTTVITLTPTFIDPQGVALDSSGNLFVADFGNSSVLKVPIASGYSTVIPVPGRFDFPSSLVVDTNDNIFLTDQNSGLVELLSAGGYTTVVPLSTQYGTFGPALDGHGNLFVSDYSLSTVTKFDYADPPSLTFATTPIGSTSSDSPQTVTLANYGNAPLSFALPTGPVPITEPTITPGFTLRPSSTCLRGASGNAALTSGASCTALVSFTPTAPGNITGTLTFADNSLNTPSTQVVPLNGTATLVPATATLAATPNPGLAGNLIAISATISTTAASSIVPTGTVQFYDNGVNLGIFTVSNGVASFSISTLTVGSHSLTCTYSGDANFAPATCNTVVEVINAKAATLTTTTDAPNPSLYGQPVVFTVHVAPASPNAAVPTGKVVFLFCHGATVTVTLDANGNATFTTPFANGVSEPAGSCPYTATYSGDAIFAPSTSASTDYTVLPVNSTTTLTAQPNPAYAGQPVTITATILGVPSPTLGPGGQILPPGAQTPTGTVQFFLNGTPFGSATITNGTATLTTTALPPGTSTLTATYPGDANLNGSTSAPITETIILPDFTLTATPPTLSIATGHRGSIPLNFTSISGFTGSITVTCPFPMPVYSTCYPLTVTLAANGTATATLTIDTNGVPNFYGSLTPPNTSPSTSTLTLATLFPLTLLTLLYRRRSKLARLLPLILLAILTTTLTSCSGHDPNTTPPGTYTITLQATGTSATNPTPHTLNITLSVTPQ